jgi:hypothetical protein
MDLLDLQDYLIDWHSDSNLRLRLLHHVRFNLSMLDEFGFKPAVARLEEFDGEDAEDKPKAMPQRTPVSFNISTPSDAPTLQRSDFPTLSAYIAARKALQL